MTAQNAPPGVRAVDSTYICGGSVSFTKIETDQKENFRLPVEPDRQPGQSHRACSSSSVRLNETAKKLSALVRRNLGIRPA